MRLWVAIAAWTLVPFGVIGLLWSLVDFSLAGTLINVVLIVIGLHDIVQLRHLGQEPRRWRSLAVTQLLIGLIIGGSLLWLRHGIGDSELWQTTRSEVIEALVKITGAPRRDAIQAVDQSFAVVDWGLLIGGVAVLLSQLWMAVKAWRLADAPRVPPPLPKRH